MKTRRGLRADSTRCVLERAERGVAHCYAARFGLGANASLAVEHDVPLDSTNGSMNARVLVRTPRLEVVALGLLYLRPSATKPSFPGANKP
jgi:hypothetical protein